jgi:hypothetical protein
LKFFINVMEMIWPFLGNASQWHFLGCIKVWTKRMAFQHGLFVHGMIDWQFFARMPMPYGAHLRSAGWLSLLLLMPGCMGRHVMAFVIEFGQDAGDSEGDVDIVAVVVRESVEAEYGQVCWSQ